MSIAENALLEFAGDVRRGLGARPKTLPPRYFYDDLGSHLFEAICQLPWYPITRAEQRLLELHAASMVAPLGDLGGLVELGCGGGEKIAELARALAGRARGVEVHLVDISDKALELSRGALAPLGHVTVTAHCASYEEGLGDAMRRRPAAGSVLVLFLGSNIGNFDPPAARRMLAEIRRALRPGDGLLLGADLVRAEADLVVAYDDPLGVTAAFNKNVLLRMNTELGADFELGGFRHRALWNAAESRVEMHLVSLRPQRARIPGAGVEIDFAEGETIWTESSYKYTPAGIVELGRGVDLRCREQWIDAGARFSTTLFLAGGG